MEAWGFMTPATVLVAVFFLIPTLLITYISFLDIEGSNFVDNPSVWLPSNIPLAGLLADISGGINRMVAIMLAIASRQQAVVLVDEIENGLYFKHQAALWRGLLALSRNFDTQLIVTTHSEEWLEALVDAASGEVDDLSLWRTERSENGPVVHQFTGKQVSAGIKAGEVR
ncbi:MAG: ATP-binding protein [Proteobacteria bacterium]|nr:ATP-binding protein [Pseudomonadota bacterium]